MIDTHCHLTYQPLFEQADAVIARALAAGVRRMITVGTAPDDARKARELAHRSDAVFFAAGLHPHYSAQWRDRSQVIDTMRELAADPRMVALGEMGLDRHYPDPPMDLQQHALDWQLELAATLDQPIIIHNREATDLTLSMLRQSGIAPGRFVFHCFTGSQQELDAILEFGAMVSFTGIITFKNARDLGQSTATVPLDRIMCETDSPYLTPEPHRKVKTNEPGYVPFVYRYLAQARNMDEAAFTAAAVANAVRFFRLPACGQ